MARCRKCGKSGLFFKVNSEGYCEYCAQQLRDEEIVRHNQEHKRQMAMAAAAAGVKPAEPVSDLKYTLGLIGSSTLTLYANRIQTHIGKTSETIPLSAVLTFTVEEHSIGACTVTVATAQAATATMNLGYGLASAVGGGNHQYQFPRTELPTAYKMRDYIANWSVAQGAATAPQPVQQIVEQKPSPADEIRKYKGLLDDGIITQEEFEAKKKQLLGL